MKFLITSLFVSTLSATAALAAEPCTAPVGEWQPVEALQSKLEKDGWQIRQIKTERGCYEAYATNAKGEKMEAYFDPKSLEPVPGMSEED